MLMFHRSVSFELIRFFAKLSKSWKYKTKFSFEDCQKYNKKKRNWSGLLQSEGPGTTKRIGVNLICSGQMLVRTVSFITIVSTITSLLLC